MKCSLPLLICTQLISVLAIITGAIIPAPHAFAQIQTKNASAPTPQTNTPVHAISLKPLKKKGKTTVSKIIDPLTLQLKNGVILRLSGIDMPDFHPDSPGPYSMLAHEILSDMLTGQSITLHQTPNPKIGRTNRMRHHLAHIERTHDRLWIQGTLISLGLARVHTTRSTPELASRMYALEANARKAKRGLWAHDTFHPKPHTEAHSFINSRQIITGQVRNIAERQSATYINFGQNWRTDFTIRIPSQHKRHIFKNGFNPQTWHGQTIEVRGWLDEHNGPVIEIDHRDAIHRPKATQ